MPTAELRPTFFASVPRLFNRIYDKVWAQVKAKGGVSEALFNVGHDSDRMVHTAFAHVWFAPSLTTNPTVRLQREEGKS